MTNTTATRQQVTITANDMLRAQGANLTADQMAVLQASADKWRSITGETGPTSIRVPVRDFHGALIGHMTYNL